MCKRGRCWWAAFWDCDSFSSCCPTFWCIHTWCWLHLLCSDGVECEVKYNITISTIQQFFCTWNNFLQPTDSIYVVDSPEKDSHIHGSTHDPQYNLQSWIAEMSPGKSRKGCMASSTIFSMLQSKMAEKSTHEGHHDTTVHHGEWHITNCLCKIKVRSVKWKWKAKRLRKFLRIGIGLYPVAAS